MLPEKQTAAKRVRERDMARVVSLFFSLSLSSLEDEGFHGNMCWFTCALFGLIN
jgi:hypothetical protein